MSLCDVHDGFMCVFNFVRDRSNEHPVVGCWLAAVRCASSVEMSVKDDFQFSGEKSSM